MIVSARSAQYGSWGDDALSFAKTVGKDVAAATVGRIIGLNPTYVPPTPVEKTNWPLIIGASAVGLGALVYFMKR